MQTKFYRSWQHNVNVYAGLLYMISSKYLLMPLFYILYVW